MGSLEALLEGASPENGDLQRPGLTVGRPRVSRDGLKSSGRLDGHVAHH